MESGKKNCIVCTKLKYEKDFNKEHVIPESIGGKYTVDKVCRDCNEKLGKEIDTPLVKSKLMAIGRNEFRIRRGNRKIPSSLKGKYEDELGNKYTIAFNESGQAYSKIIPKINFIGDTIQITIDKSQEDQIEKIINRKFNKKGKTNFELKTIDRKEVKGEPKILFEIDKNDSFIFGALKIAYEFTHEVCSDYLNDELSEIYRTILLKPEVNEKVKSLLMEDMNLKNWFTRRVNTMNGIQKYHHLVFLTPIRNIGLFCFVKLFDRAFLVKMSDSEYLSSEVILLNDAKEGACGMFLNVKLKSFDLRLISYNGKSQPSDLISNDKGQVAVFDENGDKLFEHLDQLLNPESIIPKREEFKSKKMKVTQYFTEYPPDQPHLA